VSECNDAPQRTVARKELQPPSFAIAFFQTEAAEKSGGDPTFKKNRHFCLFL
jgi:hypothetical protein